MNTYEKIIKDLSKYTEEFREDYDFNRFLSHCENMEALYNLSEEFGIDFSTWCEKHVTSGYLVKGWNGAHDDQHMIKMCGGRTISWEDDGKVPENGEWLYKISFSTGAYIFGQHYPQQLFKEFFNELKSLSPKYCDTANSALYFSSENASEAYEAYPKILKKYKDKIEADKKRIELEETKKKLKALEEELKKV